MHKTEPVSVWYEPLTQATQDVEPFLLENVPLGQGTHNEAPVEAM